MVLNYWFPVGKFYEKCLRESQDLTEEPQLPRYRKRPRRLDDGASPHHFLVPKEHYRRAYFEESDVHLIKKIDILLLNAANGQATDLTGDVHDYLQVDVDCSRLSIQLAMIPDMIRTVFSLHPVYKVTNVQTIADAMNQSEIYKSMLGEVDKVLFTFPVTSATAERSFSLLRSSMSHCWLNNLFLL